MVEEMLEDRTIQPSQSSFSSPMVLVHKKEVSNIFIIVIPKSEGNNVIIMFVDILSKYAHFFALSRPFEASIVVATFMEIVQKLHGTLKIIVSDRDLVFVGKFWLNYFLVWASN